MSEHKNPNSHLVWIDMEMTGLNPFTDKVLEIALIVTDKKLNLIETGPSLVIHQSQDVLNRMDEWNTTHHQSSGLWASSLASKISVGDAEAVCLEFVNKHVKKGESPLCGNTVWQDRRFLFEHMPKLEQHFHYRVIDTSCIKELFLRWYPEKKPFKKREAHRALDDIIESIDELKFYLSEGFIRAPF